MNDEALFIEKTLAGDTAAFGHLVTRYQDRLYNTLVHVVGSTDDAADVVQDAFVQAYTKLRSFHGNSAFYTWLYRIAFNLAVSRRRKQRATISLDASRDSTGEEPTAIANDPSDRLVRQERAQQVQCALARLSEEHRTILVLREVDGCDYETIGEILDLPVGTVRSRLHRARLQLRDQLRDTLQEDLK